MDDKSRAFEEFKSFCDIILKETGWTKKALALKLEIDHSYWSRLYHGRSENMPNKVLADARKLAEELMQQKSGTSPEKIAVQEQLPLNLAQAIHEIAKIQAVQDREWSNNNQLRERVAVLEERLKQSQADSEKKIYELEGRCVATIKLEIERISGRLAGGSRQART